jgi:circadian clock protein KaiB
MNTASTPNAIARDPSEGREVLLLRLYVANKLPNSARALANLEAICQEHLGQGCYELDVVDILLDPLRGVADQILVTPTLVKLTPPCLRIVGDLSERQRVLDAFGLSRSTL